MKKDSAGKRAGFDAKTKDTRLKAIEEKSLKGKSERVTPPTEPQKCRSRYFYKAHIFSTQ